MTRCWRGCMRLALDRGVWHVMTGLPYMICFVVPTLGLRGPKVPVRGMGVAGRVEAVGRQVTLFQPGDEVLAGATAPTPSTPPLARTISRRNRPQSASSRGGCSHLRFGGPTGPPRRGSGPAGTRVLIIGGGGRGGVVRRAASEGFGAEVTGVCSTPQVDWSARSAPMTSLTTPTTIPPTGATTMTSSSTPRFRSQP
jgi:hypothetical protein